jgi:hypothetical protein
LLPSDEIELSPMLFPRESDKKNSGVSESMTATYLEKLNREQRQAVEHGIEQNGIVIGPPLLVMSRTG